MFHFDSLAHDNSAISQQILDIVLPAEREMASPSDTPLPIILHGEQLALKFNSTTPDPVRLFVALYRIEAKRVDLVLTANIPIPMTENSPPDDEALVEMSKQKFDMARESLKIHDFDLFA
ncbi:hypothetical protein JB92DRAFT_3021632 [Gautieria morchelliformis]|nr:hypothetical protein JB92DRAFT_3021632 [Gautieria morchelliformis]